MTTVKSIASRDNSLLLRLRKLAGDPGAYRKLGSLLIEGEHLCAALLQRGGVPSHALITEAAWQVPRLRQLAGAAVDVSVLAPELMAGVSALESPTPLVFVVPWAGAVTMQPGVASVVLDRLQDAGNVGAVLRSAAAFGFRQVLALKGTAALWSPKVLRAGMGAHFGLHLVEGLQVRDLDALAVPMVATSLHTSNELARVSLPRPCAWVFGHEGQGVQAELLARCALSVRIPQPGGEESLNVAAAAAICLYESVRAAQS